MTTVGDSALGGPICSPMERRRRAGVSAQAPSSTSQAPSEDKAATALLSVALLRALLLTCASRVVTYCSIR